MFVVSAGNPKEDIELRGSNNIEVIEGKNMPHIWPFIPVMKEAKTALNRIIHILNT